MKKRTNMRLAAIVLSVLLVMLSFASCGTTPVSEPESTPLTEASSETPAPSEPVAEPVELFVSAAASLTDAMTEVGESYKEAAPDVTLTISFASSGALQAQIEEGAPADVFVSAAQKQMDALEEKELIAADTRRDLLINKVVLIVPADSPNTGLTFEEVATDKVSKVALGEPSSVPAGQYAEEVFNYLAIMDAITAKTTFGSDVRTVLTWVESGEVDCGVVYATDAAITDGVVVTAEAPEGSHKPVVYPAAMLASSKNVDAAKAFLDYLSTPEIGAIFEKYGFALS
ncbi:MAG: molybdate ABC transporter substrate-binding protein [Acetanaerobacterium sp.]